LTPYWLTAKLTDAQTDCYTNTYHQEIDRDLNIMQEVGATTIIAANAWQYDAQHSQFLKGLVQLNMTLAITLVPQLGDNSMRRYLEGISSELRKHHVKLEFINVDYDLDFDNAEEFFMFAGKLRTWLDQLEFGCPLVIQFFKGSYALSCAHSTLFDLFFHRHFLWSANSKPP
jgi:hypothetical protein